MVHASHSKINYKKLEIKKKMTRGNAVVSNIDSFNNDSIENLGEMMGDDRLENKA